MNLKPLKLSSIALLAAGFAACSDAPSQGDLVEGNQTRYINVSLRSANGASRASDNDFMDGNAAENNVKKVVFVFFDRNGDPVGQPCAVTDLSFNSSTGNVGEVATTTAKVTLQTNENLPAYVMAFVNPSNDVSFYQKNFTELEKSTVETILNDDLSFLMCNSVYFGSDPISGQANARIMATPILAGSLYSSQEEAMANSSNTIDIYVERYAAKVNLGGTDAFTIEPVAVSTGDMQFVPTYWSVNSVEKRVYRVKTFGTAAGSIDATAFYNSADERGYTWNWNDEFNSRSYWACSPSYYSNRFPAVSDNVVEGKDTEGNTVDYNAELVYKSLNGIIAEAQTSDIRRRSNQWSQAGNYIYARETTSSSDAFNSNTSDNPKAAIASVVLIGEYILPGKTDAQTFYLFGSENNVPVVYDSEAALIDKLLQLQNVVCKGDVPVSGTAGLTAGTFVVRHPSWEVTRLAGNAVVSDQYVTLQLDPAKVNGQGLQYWTGSAYAAINTTNVDEINALLMRNAGFAECYYNGLGYYNIPVKHLGWSSSMNDADGNIDWSKTAAGAFGIVRNHVYDIKINKISGRATGSSGGDRPIVPPIEETNYYINSRLNVLNWRIVPTQVEEL